MIDTALRARLIAFLQPLYQDLDGVSRFEEVERVAAIARRLYTPPSNETRAFELLLLFHGTGKWIDKIGNRSRAVLVTGLSDDELRSLAGSIRRLEEPVSDAERALASAIVIDSAGVRGFASRLSRARREGSSIMDVVREALADVIVPEWMTPQGRAWLAARYEARREVCARILREVGLEDLV
jgi:hypothetical protein